MTTTTTPGADPGDRYPSLEVVPSDPVLLPNAPAPAEYGSLRTGAHFASLVLSAMLGTLIRLGFMALGECESAAGLS